MSPKQLNPTQAQETSLQTQEPQEQETQENGKRKYTRRESVNVVDDAFAKILESRNKATAKVRRLDGQLARYGHNMTAIGLSPAKILDGKVSAA
jgi:hypothetical protein